MNLDPRSLLLGAVVGIGGLAAGMIAMGGSWIAITGVSTVVLAVATGVLAWATDTLARETRDMRAAQTEPALTVYLVPHAGYFAVADLVVANLGHSAAHDVQWSHDSTEDNLKQHALDQQLTVLTHLHYLPPGERFRLSLEMVALLREPTLQPIRLTARYQTEAGEHRTKMFVLDFEQYRGMEHIGGPPEYEVAAALKTMKDDLHPVLSGYRRLRVTTITEQEAAEEERQARERSRAMRQRNEDEPGE